MKLATLTIVGVGLIGGSIGLAIRRRRLAVRIIGTDQRPAHLERAQSLGAIDEIRFNIEDAVRQSNIVIFCTPVNCIVEQVLEAARVCSMDTLLSDCGSTKAVIVREIESRLPRGISFVGGHPLAGSEKSGPENADADLFQDRLTIITPTPSTSRTAVERVTAFWQALGARVRLMDPVEHDQALSLTSHLPHLLASALAGMLPPELHDLTARGFRDITRIAAGDPSLWTAIFLHNRAAVLQALEMLTNSLSHFRSALEAGDIMTIDRLLVHAKKVRDALGN